MYLKNIASDNAIDTSWAMSETPYGDGDYGTPGRAWDDTTSAGIDDIIELPVENITSCTFGGSNLQTLFITTARWGMTKEDIEKNLQYSIGQKKINFNVKIYFII